MKRLLIVFLTISVATACTSSLEHRAKQGDSDAQYALACRYIEECAADSSYITGEKAASWLKRAAENGNAEAQCFIGNILAGSYIPRVPIYKNLRESIKWYEKSAAQGNAEAQFKLADLYHHGLSDYVGVNDEVLNIESDINRAIDLYEKSVAQNYVPAYGPLASLYLSDSIGTNTSKAISLIRYAAINNDPIACYNMGYWYTRGVTVGGQIVIGQNYNAAINWLLKAIEQNKDNVRCTVNSQVLLGNTYSRIGSAFEKKSSIDETLVFDNYNKSIYWYTKAAQNGHIDSQAYLGSLYFKGDKVERNIAKSVEWFKLAADQGDEYSKQMLKYIKYLKQ